MREHGICLALCAGWLLLGTAAAGRAQLPPAVAVSVDPCVPVDHAKLHELLAIELGTSTIKGSALAATTRVDVSCSATGIELRVEDGVTRKSMARVLPAASFADASSTRLLALAIAEFVVASWIELNVRPAPSVEPIGPRAGEAARRVAQSAVDERTPAAEPVRNAEPALFVAGGLQFWSPNELALFSGGLRVQLPLSEMLLWTASAELAGASDDAAYGRLQVFTSSATLALVLQLRVDHAARLQFGPGGRLGLAHIDGDADPRLAESDDFIAPYGGPLWLTRGVFHLGDTVRVAAELEVGFATLPARAEVEGGGAAFELAGLWVNGLVGLGIAF
jgi:hypothetical protein